MSTAVVRISVRAVVEMTLHEKDLSPAAFSARRMQEGAAAHRARQESAKEREYQKEVALSADYEGEALLLHVTGRADGIFVRTDGRYVIEEIKRLSGRLPVIHFKDMFVNEAGEKFMSWVGGGNQLDFEKIIPAFEAAGTKLAYIEQDNCNGENPFDCLKKSYDYLTSLGLK